MHQFNHPAQPATDDAQLLTAVVAAVQAAGLAVQARFSAWCNGTRLRTSGKTALNAAMAGTGQAVPDEGSAAYRRIGQSVTAMLAATLVVSVSVPATLQLVQVAAGRQDLFWQYSQVRSGLLAGALLVAEAGGSVTDLHGAPWHLDSTGLLASAPALSAAAVAVLATIA